jgi:hypothetical protein
VIIACTQYFTAFFLMKQGKLVFGDLKFFLLSVSTVMIAAAGYIINDYYDIKIDFINKTDRVVIGKSITRRYAILFHTILSGLGILIGAYVSLWIGAVNVISVFLLWLYSNLLKRLPFVGNLSVAFLTALALVLHETGEEGPGADPRHPRRRRSRGSCGAIPSDRIAYPQFAPCPARGPQPHPLRGRARVAAIPRGSAGIFGVKGGRLLRVPSDVR